MESAMIRYDRKLPAEEMRNIRNQDDWISCMACESDDNDNNDNNTMDTEYFISHIITDMALHIHIIITCMLIWHISSLKEYVK